MKKFSFNTMDINKIGKFKCEYINDFTITDVSSNKIIKNNSLTFFNEWVEKENENISCQGCLIIVPLNANLSDEIKNNNYIIYSKNPRMKYAVILDSILKFSCKARIYRQLDNYVVIGENVEIGKFTRMEPFVFIDHDVVIADNCIIKSGVKIGSYVQIGKSTTIRENSVIGGQGFGIEKDSSGKTFRIPHLGGVVIGKNVEIGALNTLVSGTIDATIIEDFVKTDDHVHIAHNCNIKKSTLITACVEISGSVTIGKNCTIGPNSSLMNKISLGENSIVGLGTVVTKSFPANVVLAGNPADTMENVKKNRIAQKKIFKEIYDNKA